ncbi:hypothetical protein V2J09_007332 [Rumex salicifolius]
MEPSPVVRYNPRSSKKRIVSGSGSGDSPLLLDEDVVEISPPPSLKTSNQKLKQKQVISHEVIDVDNDEDHDLMIIENSFVHSSKGKRSVNSYLSDHDVEPTDTVNLSKGVGPISHNLSTGDGSGQGLSYLEDFYGDENYNELIFDDECAMLQAHFDSIDVPSGVEAAIPWWPSSEDSKNQDVSVSSSLILPTSSFPDAGTSEVDDSQSSQTYKDSLQSKNHLVKPKRTHFSPSSIVKQPYSAPTPPNSSYAQQYSNPWAGFAAGNSLWSPHLSNAAVGNPLPLGIPLAKFPFPGWKVPGAIPLNITTGGLSGFHDSSVVLDQGIAAEILGPSALVSSSKQDDSEALIVKKLESFKKFDTVQDHSDHHYSSKYKKPSQPSKAWVKKIQEEWRILEKDLPDTIFVRVYETRMDILRAVIIGADGTPYHDGIFFFDVHFPPSYPNVPPHVYYHSGGLRLNPNLYNNGKVCLSLLNTWSGRANEKWVPGLSTTLQVLVSIQGLILNAKPFFNEPGYVSMQGKAQGEKQSESYNENTFLLSLKTMLYSMRRPPKYFDDFVFGHFYKHAHDILIACKAYFDGAQIGTLVKGGIQDVDVGDKSCSETFKMHLTVYINSLVQAFTKIGVKGCEKYSLPVNNTNPVPTATPSSSSRSRPASIHRKKSALKMKM